MYFLFIILLLFLLEDRLCRTWEVYGVWWTASKTLLWQLLQCLQKTGKVRTFTWPIWPTQRQDILLTSAQQFVLSSTHKYTCNMFPNHGINEVHQVISKYYTTALPLPVSKENCQFTFFLFAETIDNGSDNKKKNIIISSIALMVHRHICAR